MSSQWIKDDFFLEKNWERLLNTLKEIFPDRDLTSFVEAKNKGLAPNPEFFAKIDDDFYRTVAGLTLAEKLLNLILIIINAFVEDADINVAVMGMMLKMAMKHAYHSVMYLIRVNKLIKTIIWISEVIPVIYYTAIMIDDEEAAVEILTLIKLLAKKALTLSPENAKMMINVIRDKLMQMGLHKTASIISKYLHNEK